MRQIYLPINLCFTGFLTLLLSIISSSSLLPMLPWAHAAVVDYDIVYVRAPRHGDTVRSFLPEFKNPTNMEPGSDLMILHPDGSEEVLVAAGKGAVADPVVSFDAQWVYYALTYDASEINYGFHGATARGSDIFKINLITKEIVRLTFSEFTPNTGAGIWLDTPLYTANGQQYTHNSPAMGMHNLAPCPLPGGKVAFVSSRNAFRVTKGASGPNLQLFILDEKTQNVEQIGYLNLGSALHPVVLTDGRILFSSSEAQGLRDERSWGLWSIWPDGTKWEPVFSAFGEADGFHWHGQLSNGDIVSTIYYNQNNNGFGTMVKFPSKIPDSAIAFGSPNPSLNPALSNMPYKYIIKQYSFSPYGMELLTPFAHSDDSAAGVIPGTSEFTGKVTQPSGAPNNDLLLIWSPGPANLLNRPIATPQVDAGIYLIRGGIPVSNHKDLVLIKNDPNYNEQQPKAVVPYKKIYGIDEPKKLQELTNDGTINPALPEGTPFGLVGTSTFYRRDTKPGTGDPDFDGWDTFYPTNSMGSNWRIQGADVGRYDSSDIYAVRILAMEPTSFRHFGPNGYNLNFANTANEKLRILGEIPLLKYDSSGKPILDTDGNPDTSFLAKIPADVPFTFQTINKDAMNLNMAQTWHQVRPGEVRNDCGGCHAHSQKPLDFASTAAAKPGYVIPNLATETPMLSKDSSGKPIVVIKDRAQDVEYYRDIKPILERSCIQCHSLTGRQEGKLALDDYAKTGYLNGLMVEGSYMRLAMDTGATLGGYPPLHPNKWGGLNRSRYVRPFQSRRSLLIWKIFGQRLDGWTNADHPTERVAGDRSTLPLGGASNEEMDNADLDYTGSMCPTPGSGVTPLTEDEKLLFARWVDLGTPIDQVKDWGWFLDELRPTLTMPYPKIGDNDKALSKIKVGMHDYYSGLDMSSFSVKATFPINGKPAGTELAPFFVKDGDFIWTLNVIPSISSITGGEINVSVKDTKGNIQKIKRSFSISTTVPTTPKILINSLAFTPSKMDARVVFLYSYNLTPPADSRVMFQLDSAPVVEDTDKDGFFEFQNVSFGNHTILGYLTDKSGNSIAGSEASQSLTVLGPINNPPVVMAISDQTVLAWKPLKFNVSVSDPDTADVVTLTPSGLPSEAKVMPISDRLWEVTWTPTASDVGTKTVSFIANDGTVTSAAVSVKIIVSSSDTVPVNPTVNIYQPAAEANVSGKVVTISASVTEKTGIAWVQFMVDGRNIGAELSAAPYSMLWDSTSIANGSHTLTAEVRNAANLKGVSNAVVVNVSNTAEDTLPPTTPTNVTGTAKSTTAIELNWSHSTDNVAVVGYIISRNGQYVGSATSSTYTDNGLKPGTTYSYTVLAYDGRENMSAPSASINIKTLESTPEPKPDTIAPSVPSGLLTKVASTTQINLSWDASTDNVAITGYKVFLNGIYLTSVTSTSYAVTGLTPSTTYSFTVSAYDAAGNTSAQCQWVNARTSDEPTPEPKPDTIAPSVPSGLLAKAASTTQINLSWDASTDNVVITGYKVFLNGTYLTSVTSTSYSATGLTPSTTYSFSVSAYDATGNTSALSQAVNAKTNDESIPDPVPVDNIKPSTPTRLAFTAVTASQIDLVWRNSIDNIGVAGYKVFRNNVEIATVTTTTYSDTDLGTKQRYNYRVAAFDAAGNVSHQSLRVTTFILRKVNTQKPSAPKNLTITSNMDSRIALSWNTSSDNTNVAGYRVYRNAHLIATTAEPNYIDNSVVKSKRYIYRVASIDAAGNQSALSQYAMTWAN